MAPSPATVDLGDVEDPTIIALWRDIYSCLDSTQDLLSGMLVCSSFRKELPSLVTDISLTGNQSKRFQQQQLVYVAKTFPNIKKLSVKQEYYDDAPPLDFSTVQLPALEQVTLACKLLVTFKFTQANTPQLRVISANHVGEFRAFDLDLPHLVHLSFEFSTVVDSRNFGPSLSKCPQLENFMSYKVLWGLSGTIHKLHLPECTTLDLSRSDDLEGLELWAPKLSMLGLRACYSLDHVRIMPDPPGPQPQALTVNLINANMDRLSKRLLKQHPRVKMGAVWTKESQEWGGLAGELGFGDDGMEDDQDSDDNFDSDDDEGYGGIGAAMMGVMHAAMQMEGGLGGLPPNQDLLQLLMMAGGMPGMPGGMAFPPFMAPGGFGAAGEDEDMEEGDEGESEGEGEEESSWETDDGGEDEGEEGDAAAGGPSCVIEEVE